VQDYLRHPSSGFNAENYFRDLFKQYLPRRYAVESGFVVNVAGERSDFIDVLIIDCLNIPPLSAEPHFKVFPAEAVVGAVEITSAPKGKVKRSGIGQTIEKLENDLLKLAKLRGIARDREYLDSLAVQTTAGLQLTTSKINYSLPPRSFLITCGDEWDVCPYLIDLKSTDVVGPLKEFQLTKADQEDTFRLICSMNQSLGDQALSEDRIKASFDKWWPDLEKALKEIPSPEKAVPKAREAKDLQEETLEIVRRIDSSLSNLQRAARQWAVLSGFPSLPGFAIPGSMTGGTYGFYPASGPPVPPSGTLEAKGSSPELKAGGEPKDKK
jgi:hypothetical protein